MVKKKCYACGKHKPLDEFNNNKAKTHGKSDMCMECNKIMCKDYSHSKDGVVSKIYGAQVRGSKTRNHPQPAYIRKELKEWLFDQQLFHDLYDNWVNSGYIKDLKPSVDRLDDYKGYSFDNIQLTTWRENYKKSHRDRKYGINNKNSKAVLQFNLDGSFVKEYYSTKQAERELGVDHSHISCVCNGSKKTAGKFIWEYSSQYT